MQLAAASTSAIGPSECISSASQKSNGPKRSNRQQYLLMQWAHLSASVVPPRNIIGQSEAIGSNICRCNGHILGQSPRNSGPKRSYWQQWQQLMQWAHPNVLAASSLNYGSGLTRSICPYFLLMGPSGLSQNHGSNCTWVLPTTTTCSVSWALPARWM